MDKKHCKDLVNCWIFKSLKGKTYYRLEDFSVFEVTYKEESNLKGSLCYMQSIVPEFSRISGLKYLVDFKIVGYYDPELEGK